MRRSQAIRLAAVLLAGSFLAGCAETQLAVHAAKSVVPGGAAAGNYKIGKPYEIQGIWYYPAVDYSYSETGIASWYGPGFHGKQTANGETFDENDITAAHRTLPMPSLVRVTNLENGRSLVVRINDRGPFAHGRIIDLSRRSAQLLGVETQGTARVRVDILADESRAMAAQLQGDSAIAQAPAAEAAPRVSVAVETLPAPGGAPTAIAEAPASLQPASLQIEAEPIAPPVTQQIQQSAVQATEIYVQAGAFSRFDNANLVAARLSGIGTVRVQNAFVNGTDVFRVRMGPLTSVQQADEILNRVIQAGYSDARIIVDAPQ